MGILPCLISRANRDRDHFFVGLIDLNNSPQDESNVDHRGMAWRWSGRLGALVLAGVILVFFRPILVPMVFAVLLSFLLVPLVTTLTSRGVHHGLSILFAEVLGTLPLLGLVMIFLTTAGPLTESFLSHGIDFPRPVLGQPPKPSGRTLSISGVSAPSLGRHGIP